MSGIFGIFDSRKNTPTARLLEQMAARMRYFPWYVVEFAQDDIEGCGLGRIGIGVFNKEEQPMRSEEGRWILVMSGEFYNARQLWQELSVNKGIRLRDQSDSQLALRLYQHYGIPFIEKVEGSFIIGIWDTLEKKLIILNDRFGTYPTYYAHYRAKLVFSPEVKGILCDVDFKKSLNMTALAETIRFQALLGDKTFFEDIHILPAASVFQYLYQEDRLSIQPYWDFSRIKPLPESVSFDEATEEAARLLSESINKYTVEGYQPGLLLSGGLDSRVILGLMGQKYFPVQSVTFGLAKCKDAYYAAKLGRLMGTRHHFIEFKDGGWVKDFADLHLDLTEGFHSWIHGHGISVLGQIRDVFNINLSGFMGAELDYDDLSLYYAPDETAFLCRLYDLVCCDTTWPSVNEGESKLALHPDITNPLEDLAFESLKIENEKLAYLPFATRVAALSLNIDMRFYFYYVMIHRSHFEDRLPFLDYAYFDFIHGLPPEYITERRLRKAVISKKLPRLSKIPSDKDDLPITQNPAISLFNKSVQRGKRFINQHISPIFPERSIFYADYENWLRVELKDWGESILLGEKIRQRGLFNMDYLDSIWNRLQSGREVSIIGKIAPFMSYEMLLERFFD